MKIPIILLAAIKDDDFRKPLIGMWSFIETKILSGSLIDYEKSFFVGDAAGRDEKKPFKKADHSDADLKFAQNVGIRFLTPEEFF